MGENAVFASDGHNIAGNADSDKVHTFQPKFVGKSVTLAVTLYQLKSDAAAGKFLVWVGAVLAFGV